MTPATATATAPARRRSADPQPAPTRRHLRVVPDPAPTSSPAGRALTTLVVLLFVALFGLVVFQAALAQSQGQLDALDGDLATRRSEAKALGLAVADAESPERITSAARDRLGMVFPAEVAFLQPSEADDAAVQWDGTTAAPEVAADGVDGSATDEGGQPGASVGGTPGTSATMVDPATGLPALGVDPATGQPVTTYDPVTGLPITGYDATGSPILYEPQAVLPTLDGADTSVAAPVAGTGP